MSGPDRDAYRFTPAGEEAPVLEVIAETIARWVDADLLESEPCAVAQLERAAWRRLGCTPYDLRDVELQWIEDRAREALDAARGPVDLEALEPTDLDYAQ